MNLVAFFVTTIYESNPPHRLLPIYTGGGIINTIFHQCMMLSQTDMSRDLVGGFACVVPFEPRDEDGGQDSDYNYHKNKFEHSKS